MKGTGEKKIQWDAERAAVLGSYGDNILKFKKRVREEKKMFGI